MKIMKSVLAAIMVLCLMMCLAVPAFATETTDATTTAATDTTEATTGDTVETPTTEAAPETEDGHDHSEDEAATGESAETTGTQTPAPAKSSALKTVLLVLEVIASIALIIVVLLQSGKESGLGKSISGNSDSYMSKHKNAGLDKMLAAATKWVALVWIVITLLLGLVK